MSEEELRHLVLKELFKQRDEEFVQVGKMPIIGIDLVHQLFIDLEREGLVEFVKRPIPWPAWCVKLTSLGLARAAAIPQERMGDV